MLNRSLGELLGLDGKFGSFVSAFHAAGDQTLEALEETLESALEKAVGRTVTAGADGPLVELALDQSLPGQPALRIELDFRAGYEASHAANLDLGGSLGRLVDVGGEAQFDVTAAADLDLDIGINLNTLEPFLYGSTQANVTASIQGSGLHFSAALGPLGLFIGNGGTTTARSTWTSMEPGPPRLRPDWPCILRRYGHFPTRSGELELAGDRHRGLRSHVAGVLPNTGEFPRSQRARHPRPSHRSESHQRKRFARGACDH